LACLPARLKPETQRRFYTGRRRGRPLHRRRKSASGSETGGAEGHAATGFGFGFGFADRRCGSARHRRVGLRVRRPAVRKRTPPLGSASGSQTGGAEAHTAAGFGFGFADRRCGSAHRRWVRLRVRRPAVRKRTPPPGRLRVCSPAVRKRTPPPGSGSQTGGAEAHAAAGFGFGFGFANRRCGSALHRRVRVRKDRLVGSATGPLGKALIR
jgi:hypothetical protein